MYNIVALLQPFVISNGGKLPKTMRLQLCDDLGNPTPESGVRLQLAKDFGLKVNTLCWLGCLVNNKAFPKIDCFQLAKSMFRSQNTLIGIMEITSLHFFASCRFKLPIHILVRQMTRDTTTSAISVSMARKDSTKSSRKRFGAGWSYQDLSLRFESSLMRTNRSTCPLTTWNWTNIQLDKPCQVSYKHANILLVISKISFNQCSFSNSEGVI